MNSLIFSSITKGFNLSTSISCVSSKAGTRKTILYPERGLFALSNSIDGLRDMILYNLFGSGIFYFLPVMRFFLDCRACRAPFTGCEPPK